jgi:hypothetical protein
LTLLDGRASTMDTSKNAIATRFARVLGSNKVPGEVPRSHGRRNVDGVMARGFGMRQVIFLPYWINMIHS